MIEDTFASLCWREIEMLGVLPRRGGRGGAFTAGGGCGKGSINFPAARFPWVRVSGFRRSVQMETLAAEIKATYNQNIRGVKANIMIQFCPRVIPHTACWVKNGMGRH